MSRLPTPGGDDGTWGGILNDFLNQEHNADGTLKNAVRPTDSRLSDQQVPTDGSVTTQKFADGAVEAALGGSLSAVGDITITSDSDSSGAGDLIIYAGTQERLRVTNGAEVKLTSPLAFSGNGLNIEQDSAASVALRLHQTSTGPVAKWRVGTNDCGFIQNDGSFKLLPQNGRAISVEGVTWLSPPTSPS